MWEFPGLTKVAGPAQNLRPLRQAPAPAEQDALQPEQCRRAEDGATRAHAQRGGERPVLLDATATRATITKLGPGLQSPRR